MAALAYIEACRSPLIFQTLRMPLLQQLYVLLTAGKALLALLMLWNVFPVLITATGRAIPECWPAFFLNGWKKKRLDPWKDGVPAKIVRISLIASPPAMTSNSIKIAPLTRAPITISVAYARLSKVSTALTNFPEICQAYFELYKNGPK